MATLFRDVSLFEDAVRRQRISRTEILPKALAKVLRISTLKSSNVPIRSADLLSCQNAGSSSAPLPGSIAAEGSPGLGESQPKGARVLAPRLNPPHAQKTLQSRPEVSGRTLMNRMACSVDINPPPRISFNSHNNFITFSSSARPALL